MRLNSVLLAFSVLYYAGCGSERTGENEQLVRWESSKGEIFTVRARKLLVDTVTELGVSKNGTSQYFYIDDKMTPAIIGLVTYHEWILVVNNQAVVGGYDTLRDKFVPAQSDELPFTIRIRAGTVVAEKVVTPTLDTSVPRNFISRIERD